MHLITSSFRTICRCVGRLGSATAILALMASVGASAAAQPPRQQVSRAALEDAAKTLEAASKTAKSATERDRARDQARRIRIRLTEGDFQPGHRILLSVYGDTTLSDTFTVRADRKLLLPDLPPISIAGVLDSELQPFLTKELATYLKNPTIRAQGLLRVSILGSVAQPGFYSFPMDFAIADAIMEAGGPANNADMNGAVIRRSGAVAVDQKGLQDAFRLGLTLNDVGVRPGDEVFVPGDRRSKWQRAATVVGVIAGLAWTVTTLVR